MRWLQSLSQDASYKEAAHISSRQTQDGAAVFVTLASNRTFKKRPFPICKAFIIAQTTYRNPFNRPAKEV